MEIHKRTRMEAPVEALAPVRGEAAPRTGLGRPRFMEASDWSQCTLCGECLLRCNRLDLSEGEARAEKLRLINGEDPRHIFAECTLCMSCNSFCPEGLKPFELILQRVAEKKDLRQAKLPAILGYLLVGTGGPGFFRDLVGYNTPEEMEILDRWRQLPGPSRDVIFPGCFGRLFTQDIQNSQILKGIPVYSPDDVCCGEWHYRAGLWDLYAEMAEKFIAHFSRLDCERLVCLCSSGYSFIGKILPEIYCAITGREGLPFEVIHFNHLLLEKIEKGEVRLKNPLSYKGAIHDSCHARRMGGEFQELMRRLYCEAGAELTELEHNHDNGICCGAASMPLDFRALPLLWNYTRGMGAKFLDVRRSDTRDVITHCEGCYLPMMLANWAFGVRLHYSREELMHAFGDEISKPIAKVMPTILKVAFTRMAPLVPRKIKTAAFPHVR